MRVNSDAAAAPVQALTGRRTPVPATRQSVGYELADVAAEGGFEPSELVVPGVPEDSTEPPDKPA